MNRICLIISFLLLAFVAKSQKLTVKITPIAPKCYVHTSYANLSGSPFPSNGMIVSTTAGAVLIDTGWDKPQTKQILRWVKKELHQSVVLCIITHGHFDRTAGIPELKKRGIRVVSTALTANKMESFGIAGPEGVLPNDTTFTLGGQQIRTYFAGAGHTGDNIVVWLSAQKVLFGGCLVKSTAAMGIGNLADAYLTDWIQTIRRVQTQFADAAIIVPGHQEWDDKNSLTYTLKLLEIRPK
jgi:metallo-beta-lactamase class B